MGCGASSERPRMDPDLFHPDIHATYAIRECVGCGACSEVFAAVLKETNGAYASGMHVAIKILDLDRLATMGIDAEVVGDECELLQSLIHANIVELITVHYFEDHKLFYIVYELLEHDLADNIEKRDGVPHTESEARNILADVVAGVAFCHGQGILHRDLKPDNILLRKRAGTVEDAFECKLADFGFAIKASEAKTGSFVGSAEYMSPEEVQGQPYNYAADMWSVGVIMYILLCGFPPFYDRSERQLFRLIKRGRYDAAPLKGVSGACKALLSKCLTVDSALRISAADFLKDPWLVDRGAAAALASTSSSPTVAVAGESTSDQVLIISASTK